MSSPFIHPKKILEEYYLGKTFKFFAVNKEVAEKEIALIATPKCVKDAIRVWLNNTVNIEKSFEPIIFKDVSIDKDWYEKCGFIEVELTVSNVIISSYEDGCDTGDYFTELILEFENSDYIFRIIF